MARNGPKHSLQPRPTPQPLHAISWMMRDGEETGGRTPKVVQGRGIDLADRAERSERGSPTARGHTRRLSSSRPCTPRRPTTSTRCSSLALGFCNPSIRGQSPSYVRCRLFFSQFAAGYLISIAYRIDRPSLISPHCLPSCFLLFPPYYSPHLGSESL